jgi:ribosomal protein S18 acetylase RimI-like enzyme
MVRAGEELIAVGMRLAPEEPEAGPWRAELVSEVASVVMRLGRGRGARGRPGVLGGDRPGLLGGERPGLLVEGRPVVLAVDGRSSSGKTTLAGRLRDAVPGSAVVHTDDIAWCHSRFGWADLLIDGVLEPARAGRAVALRPPRWEDRGRPGAIEVPAGCSLLIVEGVGAARRESAHLIDVAIWVQADDAQTDRRNLARVGTPNGSATVRDHLEWMAEEIPFVAEQRPWERVDLVVCGTPLIAFDPATELVVAPPPAAVRIVRASPGLVWRAYHTDQAAGAVRAFLRPDNRWFVAFEHGRGDSDRSLLAAVAANLGADLYATADDRDDEGLDRLARLGFTVHRRESSYVIPVGPTAGEEPEGIVIISAANADEDDLRRLDDTLRQDVPGTAGWTWDPGDFREETFDSAEFDPATYLVAVDVDSARYVGLVRVWNSPGRPRLGLIGVTRAYRRRGLARALLARAFGVLHQRGRTEVTAEADDTNIASMSLLLGLGARREGGSVEFIRRTH